MSVAEKQVTMGSADTAVNVDMTIGRRQCIVGDAV